VYRYENGSVYHDGQWKDDHAPSCCIVM
jgi:hypothetical protein